MARIISKYAINRYFRLYKIQIDEYALLITCKFERIDYTLLVNRIINDLTSKPYVFDASEIYYNVSVFNEDVHNYVKELKIDYSQGYHISYPLSEYELITFLNNNKTII